MANIPALKTLFYHITNGCNLKCKYCWLGSTNVLPHELSLDEAKDIVLQAIPLGLETVRVTGGEPCIVPWLIDFLEFVDSQDIGVALMTNGTRITAELAKRLAPLKVDGIGISLDGSHAAIHESFRGVKGCFDATVAGIRHLNEVGLHPGILAAIDRTNVHDIPDLVAFADTLEVSHIQINVIIPKGRGRQLQENDMLLSYQENKQLFESLPELQKGVSTRIQMIFPPLLSRASSMRPCMCVPCNLLHVLGVLADGRIAMCEHGNGNTDDRLIYGNARQTSLREIWQINPPPVLQELRATFPEQLSGVCGECIFKHRCKGSCRADAFERYGSITAPSPLCHEALEAGNVSSDRLVKNAS